MLGGRSDGNMCIVAASLAAFYGSNTTRLDVRVVSEMAACRCSNTNSCANVKNFSAQMVLSVVYVQFVDCHKVVVVNEP